MKSEHAKLRGLQARHRQGETLTSSEQEELSALVQMLPEAERALFERELSSLALLRGWLEQPCSAPELRAARELELCVLESLGAAPRLRVVPEQGLPTPAPSTGASSSGSMFLWPPGPALVKRVLLSATVVAGLVLVLGWLGARGEHPEQASVDGGELHGAAQPTQILSVPRLAELSLLSGQVWINGSVASETWSALASGTVISTTSGRACLTAHPEIEVCLDEGSEVVLRQQSAVETLVEVRKGLALARLTKREPGQTFSLFSQRLKATAVGTVFALHARSDDRFNDADEVTVLEGTVRVQAGNDTDRVVSVGANTRLVSRDGAGFQTVAVGRQQVSKAWSLLGHESWARTRDVGLLRVNESKPSGPSSAAPRVYVDATGPWLLPLALSLPQGLHNVRLAGSDAELSVEVTAGEVTVTQVPERVSTELEPAPGRVSGDMAVTEPGTPARRAASSSEELLLSARASLTQGDRLTARSLYRQLVARYPNSAEAQSVRVTVGQLELESGSASQALKAFDQYLSVGGPLAPEALAGKVRALDALGRKSDAQAAIKRYLQLYPNHHHASRYRQRLQQTQ